uniref:Uncharacterized protein n=1 Tax=Papilio xuthus TaxID=66420 RepID=I4DKU2_PAPXU|nr:unknown unsecreted protein [Papilio xuthus]
MVAPSVGSNVKKLIKKSLSSGQNCESKPFPDPLERTQKISSKSVQSFERSSVTYTLTEELYIKMYYFIHLSNN